MPKYEGISDGDLYAWFCLHTRTGRRYGVRISADVLRRFEPPKPVGYSAGEPLSKNMFLELSLGTLHENCVSYLPF